MLEYDVDRDWKTIRKKMGMRVGDHRLNYARMSQVRNHLAALYPNRKKVSPHHYDIGMRFINEHILAELGSFRRKALNPEERKMILDLLPQRYADLAHAGTKRIDALRLLEKAGPSVAPLFNHFIKTLEVLFSEDGRFKKMDVSRYTTKEARKNPAKNPVLDDLFTNPLLNVLMPVQYGEYFEISDPKSISGYLEYLKKHGA